jgi:hypothetical protein
MRVSGASPLGGTAAEPGVSQTTFWHTPVELYASRSETDNGTEQDGEGENHGEAERLKDEQAGAPAISDKAIFN